MGDLVEQFRLVLYSLLLSRGYSQKWLAEQIDVTPATVSRMLHGAQTSMDIVVRVADALNVSLDYLTGRSSIESPATENDNMRHIIGDAFMRCTERDRGIVLQVLDDYFTECESKYLHEKCEVKKS